MLWLAIILIFGAQMVLAAVPPQINYQGRLTKQDGAPLTDGHYTISFRIYDVATGGSYLWQESHDVTTKLGYFNVALGSKTVEGVSVLDFTKPLYLGVEVGSDSEMSPRQPLNTVPYAMCANNAITVSDGAVTNAKLAYHAVTADKMENSAVITDKIADNAVTTAKIADGAVNQADMALNAVMPVGSIIAWHKTLYSILPSNWVECSGGTVSDPNSPLNGKSIPNLNGEGRFLRGGTTSGVMQADELRSHNHKVITSWTSSNRTEWHIIADWSDPDQGPLVETAPGDGPSVTNTGGSETRPINMSVIWIMKIK